MVKVLSEKYVVLNTHGREKKQSTNYLLQVRLVQKTDTGKIYAMKTLKKEEMLKKDQVS